MKSRNIELFFQEDKVYFDILKRFKQSEYIKNPEEKARYFRAFVGSYAAVVSVGLNMTHAYASLVDQMNKTFSNKPGSAWYNYRFSTNQTIAIKYFDRDLKDFCDFYAAEADRFQGYEIDKLHLCFANVEEMKEYEGKPFIRECKEQLNLHTFQFNNKFDIKNYADVMTWSVNQLFEALFHRWNALCWFRYLSSDGNSERTNNEQIYWKKYNDVSMFFNELLISPLTVKHARLMGLPYFYENPIGSNDSKKFTRIKSQAHAFAFNFAGDLLNGLFEKLSSKSRVDKNDYIELYAIKGHRSIDELGGKLLSGYLLPIVDILILEEAYSVKFSINSISEVLGIYDARKTKKYIEESKKRLKLDYLSKLAAFYKHRDSSK
ncbi:MAG: hypothetical protein EP298_08870 [Gammaproteobacteria bacterium]|nr:MAG: hypothetical protein EP298_08870 [Gammaproteobacteria bacterium]UTW42403.1 hypothetical protein KFE69_13120 [bacterium SCSIO 12844]